MKKIVLLASLFVLLFANSYSQNNNSTAIYSSKFPFYSYYEYSWSASIYNKNEVGQSQIGSITLFLKNSVTTTLENCEVYFASTKNAQNDLSLIDNAVKVFSGNISIVNNNFTIVFDTPYNFTDENIVVYFVNNSNKAVYPMPEYLSKNDMVKSTIFNYSVFANHTEDVLESNSKPIILFNNAETSSIISNNSQQPSIFPNPAVDELNIENATGTITIYNSIGNLIVSQNNTKKIDISNLTKGVYFIEFLSDNDLIIRKQFIKY